MDYRDFKKYIEENLKEYLPKEFEGTGLLIRSMQKVNREVDAIIIAPNKENIVNHATPIIYVNDLYKRYLLGDSLEEILLSAGNAFAEYTKYVPAEIGNLLSSKDRIMSQVTVALINTEANKELLKDVVHKEFHDLSVIYKWVIKSDENGILTTTIRNEHLNALEINAEELHKIAMENTRNNYPVMAKSMEGIMGELLLGDEFSGKEFAEVERQLLNNAIDSSDMFVITNSVRTNGATAMLFEDELHKFSQSYGGNFYIIPCSVHEIIVVSPKHFEVEQLAEMVFDVNKNEVDVSERLSNEIYLYDQEKREVIQVTDVPNKDLRNMDDGDMSIIHDEPEVSR